MSMLKIFRKDSGWAIGTITNIALTLMLVTGVTAQAAANPGPQGPDPKVTICHATSSTTNPFVTIHVSANATSGHFDENGTPLAGHEDDILINDPNGVCPTNTATTGTLIVIKNVSGGTASASDFSMHVKNGSNVDVTGSPQNGNNTTGNSYDLAAGNYTVSETGGLTGYTASFSSGCSGGNVSLALGQTVTCTVTNTFSTPNNPGTVKVTLVKYLDGQAATATSANNYAFPMTSTWNATNIGAGSGSFTLGPTGFNNPNPYQATTSDMSSGADYTASEDTGGSTLVLAAADTCVDGKYRLVGYQSGDTLAQALAATSGTTAPNFTNITSDKFIVVSNETCPTPNTSGTLKVHIVKYLDGSLATAASANNYQFPMTATWQTSNLNGGVSTSGTYVLGNNHGGASDLYGADTAAMDAPADYTTAEVTDNTSQVLAATAACQDGKYRLIGYQTGNTLAQAQGAVSSTTAPNFTGLVADKYVIVSNETCPVGAVGGAGTVDLALTKIVSNASPSFNSNVTYTITVINNGPDDATGVIVNDLLPAGATFVSSVVSTGSYNSTTGVWTIGALANGANATLSLVAQATAARGTSVTNTGTVSGTEIDSDTSNNTDSATFRVRSSSGGGGGGGGSGGGTNNSGGQVLGESTDVPFSISIPASTPTPAVLGESAVLGEAGDLPRTGTAASTWLLLFLLLAVPFALQKQIRG